eukprot:TRINITY_DN13833_c0_g1_i1.p1 TRINITY_DN13833_c0_g1~~TRINITY_DN13833_c0_g1_i1.p1  ORF type:complete len:768 (-),score=196.06 TRINITY_DN13833_c0_g1_i1:65-2263(-)
MGTIGENMWIRGEMFTEIRSTKNFEVVTKLDKSGRCFTSVGDFVWMGSEGAIHIYKNDGTFSESVNLEDNVVTKIAFTTDNVWLGFENGNLKIYGKDRNKIKDVTLHHTSKITALYFSASPEQVWVGDEDGSISVWKVDGTLLKKLDNKENMVADIVGDYSLHKNDPPQNKYIFVTREKEIDVYQPNFKKVAKFTTHCEDSLSVLAFDDSNGSLWAGCYGGSLNVFKVQAEIKQKKENLSIKSPKIEKMQSTTGSVEDKILESDIKIEFNKTLGKSPYGVVYKGLWRNDAVAVKVLQLDNFSEEEIQQLKTDISNLSKVKQKNLMHLYCYKIEKNVLTIVQERMKFLSIRDTYKNEKPRFAIRMKYAKDVGQCIAWVHKSDPPLYNLDLRTNNILVGRDHQIKVDGFVGLSKIKNVSKKNPKIFYKSHKYCAPEILLDKPYNEKADIWSFGLLLWELTTLEQPWIDIVSYDQLVDTVCKKQDMPKMGEDFDPILRKVIGQCLSYDPEKRPTMQDVIKSIPQIQLEYHIKDQSGIIFWREKFGNDQGGYSEVIQFELFIEELYNYLGLSDPDFESEEVVALKALVCVNGEVNYIKFGDVIQKFGHLEKGTKTLDKILDTVKLKGFHGDISKTKSNSLLVHRADYLIRFSSNQANCFVIELIDSKKSHVSAVVENILGKGYKLIQSKDRYFPNLEKLISYYKSNLGFKTPIVSNEFKNLFKKNEVISGGYGVLY